MSSHGSIYGQFRRALDAGQVNKSLALATELPRVELDDALDLVILLAAAGDRRFDSAARRWLQRFAAETRAPLQQVVMAGAALAELGRSPSSEVARDTLEHLLGSPR